MSGFLFDTNVLLDIATPIRPGWPGRKVSFGQSNGHLLVLQIDPAMKVPGSKADSVRTVRSITSPTIAMRGKGKAESKMTHVGWTVTIVP